VKIHWRIGPPCPLACCKRQLNGDPWGHVRIDTSCPFVCLKRRLNGVVLRMRLGKLKPSGHSRCGTLKNHPWSKSLSAEHRPNVKDSQEGRLIVYEHISNFHLSGNFHYYWWEDCNLHLSLAFMTFSSEVLYMPHQLRHKISIFKVISERSVIPLYICWALPKERSLPILTSLVWCVFKRRIFILSHLLWHTCFSGLIWRTTPFSHLLWHTKGCWGPIPTRVFTGFKCIWKTV
jgi:hypothetical protein